MKLIILGLASLVWAPAALSQVRESILPTIIVRPEPVFPREILPKPPPLPPPTITLPPGLINGPLSPPILPILNDVLTKAAPNIDLKAFQNVRSYGELSYSQSQIMSKLPEINEEFFRQVAKKRLDTNATFEDVSTWTPPSPGQSVLSLISPKLPSTKDLRSHLEKQRGRRLDLDNPADNEMVRDAVNKAANQEAAIMGEYFREQGKITRGSTLASLKSLSTIRPSIKTKSPTQAVQINRDTLGNADIEAIRREAEFHGHRQSPSPPKTPSLQPLFSRLESINPQSEQTRLAKSYGLVAVNEADIAFRQGDTEMGNLMETAATAFADIGMGFIPVVGVSRDIYELFTGRSLLTGQELSGFERSLAAVGIVTGGVVSTVGKAMKASIKVGQHADEMAKIGKIAGEVVSEMKRMGVANSESAHALKKISRPTGQSPVEVLKDVEIALMFRAQHLGLKFKAIRIGRADDLNASARSLLKGEYLDSYRHGSKYIDAVLTEPSINLVRVFSSNLDNKIRPFVVDKRLIEGLTPEEIKKVLNLTYVPDSIVDVSLKAETKIRISQAASIGSNYVDGTVQIEIVSAKLDPSIFGRAKAIGEKLK